MNKFKKTVAFTIILCTLLSSLAGCNDSKDNDLSNIDTTAEQTTVVETEEDTSVETEQETTLDNFNEETTEENKTNISDSIQDDEYSKFQASVDSNVYEKWLEEKWNEGIEAPKNIYATYLKLWKNELAFTIEYGKDVLDDDEKYESWKANLEQWLTYTSQTLTLEMNQLLGTMTQLEVIIPHCELVRQKVIDTKYFLYQLEIQNAVFNDPTVSTPEVSVKWRFDDMDNLVEYINHTHSFGEWQTVKYNCVEGGIEERYCACGDKESRDIAAVGEHSECKWVTLQEPTKLKKGLKVEQCSVCKEYIRSEAIPAKGSSGLMYKSNKSDMTCIVTGIGTCSDRKVYIPEYILGYKVVGIADEAFTNEYSIQSVVLPDTITSIGKSAFAGCTALETINIPEGVTEIQEVTFASCVVLSKIELPSSIKSIGDCAFLFCDKLTKINIPANVNYIHSLAFASCPKLSKITVDENNEFYKSIDGSLYTKDGSVLIQYAVGKSDKTFTLPDGVISIDDSAFVGCTSLTKIILSEGLKEIGTSAFSYCTNLKSITIPRTVTKISYSIFDGCKKLDTITYTGTQYEWLKFLDCDIYGNISESASDVTINCIGEDGK